MSSAKGHPRDTPGAGLRGVIKVRQCMVEARDMRAAGKSPDEIAAHFNVSKYSVQKWILQVEEAEADARNRAAR